MSEAEKKLGIETANSVSKLDDRQREVLGYIAEGMALEREISKGEKKADMAAGAAMVVELSKDATKETEGK